MNKALIKEYVKLQKAINQVVPEIYACFAKALYELNWTPEEIEALFARTQDLWNENINNMDDMITYVSKETGIDVRARVEEK